MKTAARRLPAVPIALAAALLTAFLVLFAPPPASAHDSILSSSPEADGTVETLPSELTLTFSAKLIDGPGATEVVVIDADGRSVADGPATVEGAIVTQPLVAEADAGLYQVIWKVVSSDGHPTSGTFSFTVTTGTGGVAAPSPEPTASSAPADTGADVAEDPEMESSFGVSPAWMIGAATVVLLAVAILVMVLFSRRGNRGPADSEGTSAR